jgi:hypothetical protein
MNSEMVVSVGKRKELKRKTYSSATNPAWSLPGLNPRLWSENWACNHVSYSQDTQTHTHTHTHTHTDTHTNIRVKFTEFTKIIQIIHFIINELTPINCSDSSRSIKDIDEKMDTWAKLKWTKRTLKHLVLFLWPGACYEIFAWCTVKVCIMFYHHCSLFQPLFLFSRFQLPECRNKRFPSPKMLYI